MICVCAPVVASSWLAFGVSCASSWPTPTLAPSSLSYLWRNWNNQSTPLKNWPILKTSNWFYNLIPISLKDSWYILKRYKDNSDRRVKYYDYFVNCSIYIICCCMAYLCRRLRRMARKSWSATHFEHILKTCLPTFKRSNQSWWRAATHSLT